MSAARARIRSRPDRVKPYPLRQLAQVVGAVPGGRSDGRPDTAPGDVQITGVAFDSRAVQPGDVYLGLPGARTHGARFAATAVDDGAVALLTDAEGARVAAEALDGDVPVLVVDDPRRAMATAAAEVYGRPATKLIMIGVTGTNGKTTTSHLLADGLRAAGRSCGMIGTLGYFLDGVELLADRTTITTPESADLQALLAIMVERGAEAVVMEVSSHALTLGRVDEIVFDVAGFTNFGRDHLDFHGTVEAYFAAKAELFSAERARRAVINIDDARGPELVARSRAAGLTVATTSLTADEDQLDQDQRDQDQLGQDQLGQDQTGHDQAGHDQAGHDQAGHDQAGHDQAGHDQAGHDRQSPVRRYRCLSYDLGADPVPVRLATPTAEIDFRLGLPGAYNVANAVTALAMIDAVGIDPVAAAAGLADASVPGRLQRVELGAGAPRAFVDFAHTPQAVRSVLTELATASGDGRLICVVGCGGDRDPDKRGPMGAVAAELSDLVIITDDNPRTEDPAAIRAATLAGAREQADRSDHPVTVTDGGDRAAAIRLALREATADDVIALLGKGHERGQEVGDTVLPFDDTEQLLTGWQELSAEDRGVRP